MTSQPRLLFVDQFGMIGGGQRVLLSMLRVAVKEFGKVSVLAPPGALEEAVNIQFGESVAYYHCEEPRLTHGSKRVSDVLALCAYAWGFRKHFGLLKKQQVIYVNGLRHLPHMLVFALLLDASIIYHVHLVHSRLERLLVKLASYWPGTFKIVVNSAFVAKRIDCGNMCVIRNALDPGFARLPFVNRFGTASWQLAVIGTLRPEKGQDIAMDAVEKRPSMTLHLIGPAGDGAEIWISALKARRAPNIIFEGTAQDVSRRIADLNIQFSLVPSRWQEPFGLVAIEGMACSCLTIVSGTGGLKEIAADTGALLARDAAGFEAVLDKLAAMPTAALAELARTQYEATQRIFAPERFALQASNLLHSALSFVGADVPRA